MTREPIDGLRRPIRRLGRLLAIALLLLALPGSAAWAARIVEFDLEGADGTVPSVLATDPFVSATDMTANGVTEWSPNGWTRFAAAAGWGTGTSYDPSKYYEWTVTPQAGHQIAYQTIDLALFRGIAGATHGAELWELHASTDGFGVSDFTLLDSSILDISSSGVDEQIAFLGQDISALGTQSGTVTFRLYGFDYTASGDYSGLGADDGTGGAPIFGTGTNLRVDGLVTPEPGSGLLVGLGLVGLGLRRRAVRRARMQRV